MEAKTINRARRARHLNEPRLRAIYFGFQGIFFITFGGSNSLRFLLPEPGLTSPLAEFMALWVGLLWLGLMVLLAKFVKTLYQFFMLLGVVLFIGYFIYHFPTLGASDEIKFAFMTRLGIMSLSITPAAWLEQKPSEGKVQAEERSGT